MQRYQGTLGRVFLLAMFLFVFDLRLALAQADFERGYKEGYGKGYQDGLTAGQSNRARTPNAGPAGIVVVRAWYGDDDKSCNLTAWAAARFNSRTGGEAEVTNQLCGDPAFGKRKSLHVDFLCNGQAKTAEAYEHRRLSLYCY